MNRLLRFEGLEARAMLTGTVTATAEGGILTITGDDAANAITVHQTANPGDGTIAVQIQGLGTKINNLDTSTTGYSATFTGVTDISIAMNGGNDVLTMFNTTIPNTLSIDMGDGNDVLTMTNVHEQLSGGVSTGVACSRLGEIGRGARQWGHQYYAGNRQRCSRADQRDVGRRFYV